MRMTNPGMVGSKDSTPFEDFFVPSQFGLSFPKDQGSQIIQLNPMSFHRNNLAGYSSF